VAFSSNDKDKLQKALAHLRPGITRLATAIKHRNDRKQAIINRAPRPQREDLWINFALGPRATDALGAGQVRELDSAFSTGMIPGSVGDPFVSTLPDGSPNPADRRNWVVGAKSQPLDLLLIFAHDHDVADASKPVISAISDILTSSRLSEEGGCFPAKSSILDSRTEFRSPVCAAGSWRMGSSAR
jgi:hypothetical protein